MWLSTKPNVQYSNQSQCLGRRDTDERNHYIQTGPLQLFVGWHYSTSFYPPENNTERRCKMWSVETRDIRVTDMCELHWFPERKRVNYKVLLLVYKTLNGCEPARVILPK